MNSARRGAQKQKSAIKGAFKSLKEFDVQQREKLENILGNVLPEESWTQATLTITLSGLGARQCQDQYKAALYVGSALSSEDLVSKITGESPKNCQVFHDLYFIIAKLDIANDSQKTIKHSLDNEKFHGLKENLACARIRPISPIVCSTCWSLGVCSPNSSSWASYSTK